MVLALALGVVAIREALGVAPIALLLLIPVGLSTVYCGLGPGLAAAFIAFLSFNYFFIIPYYTLRVHQPGDLLVLIIFLVVALTISHGQARRAGRKAAAARGHPAL
jgi:two-component system sensor histidine kinase KdpD